MSDNKQLKTLGLRFARALHMSIKTALIFTVEHRSVERPIQQSFQVLNQLLKEMGQFTFGFIDNQVMLNNLLTSDPSLRQLETEFLKRGIAAVTFEPGLSLARYKRLINLLSTNSKVIEGVGGLLVFLDQNEVEGARILPAAKNQKKDEYGDTIIETDSEAYILSKQMSEEKAPRDLLDSIDALLQSACFDQSTRAEVFSGLAEKGMDGSGFGLGVGISMPNLVILQEGETIRPAPAEPGPVSAGPGASPSGPGVYARAAAAGERSGGQSKGNPGFFRAGSTDPSLPAGDAFSAGGGHGLRGHANGQGVGCSLPSGSGSLIDLVEASVQRSLLEEHGDAQKSCASLARILRNMGVDKVLSHFPAERREELNSLPPEQLAAEFIEDTAFQLAGAKLSSAGGQSQKFLIEEEVVRVLARSLQATHMADRLAQKLTKFIQDFAVPAHVQEKIREELRWTSLNSGKKYALLLGKGRYSAIEFRRMMELSKELIGQRDIDRASALASHYFDFLDQPDVAIDISELSRAPELFRSIPLAQVGFASKTAERLGRTLLRDDIPELVHFQAASALAILSQSIVAFEDFEDAMTIASFLETSLNRNPEEHKQCCSMGLARILPAAAIERIIELFLIQRGDPSWAKIAVTLLRCAAPASVESVFHHLALEQDAKNRVALVRLAGQLGKESIEVARKYLADERWYVVRNMCGVLAALKDSELAEHIIPALQHSDARVQQAALKALVNSRTVRAAPVLADSLCKLAPNILDEALDELTFLRHVKTVAGLEKFVSHGGGSLAAAKKAVQVLACIDDDEALHALDRLLRMDNLDSRIRRTALTAICGDVSAAAAKLLQSYAATPGPFAEEVRAELKTRVPKTATSEAN